MNTAHPLDILVVAWTKEGEQYPEFTARQVISTNSTQILHGRRIRRAYLTPGCGNTPHGDEFFDILRRHVHAYGTELRPVAEMRNDYALDELEAHFNEESVTL